MTSENEAAVRAAVEHAMSTLTEEQIHGIVMQPYLELRTETVAAKAA